MLRPRSSPLIPSQFTALAQGVFLVAGMILSAGPAAAMISADVASAEEPACVVQAVESSALSHAIIERSHDLSPDPLGLECEQLDGEGGVGPHRLADDDPVIEEPTARRRPRGAETVLVDCDAVGAHAARGPPAG